MLIKKGLYASVPLALPLWPAVLPNSCGLFCLICLRDAFGLHTKCVHRRGFGQTPMLCSVQESTRWSCALGAHLLCSWMAPKGTDLCGPVIYSWSTSWPMCRMETSAQRWYTCMLLLVLFLLCLHSGVRGMEWWNQWCPQEGKPVSTSCVLRGSSVGTHSPIPRPCVQGA